MRRQPPFAAALLLLAGLFAACAPSTAAERQRDEVRAVESRVLAPCCWMGTVDVHESPVARELRDEITRRVAAGEPADQIVDDLAARYGERIRATPPGGGLSWFLYVGGVLAFLGAALVARRWVRRGRARVVTAAAGAAPARSGDERFEDQLDDELSRLD